MVCGETGVGKELVARNIHAMSGRGPFVGVNCGAVSPDLFANELFGHDRGAYTNADRDVRGFIEAAEGGTLFLDEVGELPPELQAFLLRFLDDSTFRRVGSTAERRADVRIIAATNRSLEEATVRKRFRCDLYYRLVTLQITVPPLRERRLDIVPIASHFLHTGNGKRPSSSELGSGVDQVLEEHSWPGNIRELRDTIRRAQVLAGRRLTTIERQHIVFSPRPGSDHFPAFAEVERDYFVSLAERYPTITAAANAAGFSRNGLYKKLQQLGLSLTHVS
jgi:DNA-binding NtrC family response regulator